MGTSLLRLPSWKEGRNLKHHVTSPGIPVAPTCECQITSPVPRRSVSYQQSTGGSATGISVHATRHLGELFYARHHLGPQLRERGVLLQL